MAGYGLVDLGKYGTFTGKPEIGVLVHFIYDPKLKAILPYYDRMPLCLPFESKKGALGEPGFLGMNLHYVQPGIRQFILDKMRKNIDLYKRDIRTRSMINYKFLKQIAGYDVIAPTIKHYLVEHVRSRYLNIDPIHYDKIIKLPTARWSKGKPYKNAV